uniref:Uncharacterized protein n=2 Tax=Picea TaxID=3328 RepID=A0A101LXU2_PICGL|nr:hypothetical protein ABT39_MTgene5490 [Picea glauca]QHR91554.1 hypothetical protein Q903MT_gene5589 [Picea sitchensis]
MIRWILWVDIHSCLRCTFLLILWSICLLTLSSCNHFCFIRWSMLTNVSYGPLHHVFQSIRTYIVVFPLKLITRLSTRAFSTILIIHIVNLATTCLASILVVVRKGISVDLQLFITRMNRAGRW